MATEPIKISVEFEGGAETRAGLESVVGAIDSYDRRAQDLRSTVDRLAPAMTAVGAKAGQVASAFGQAASSLGRISPALGRAGQLMSQLGGATTALTGALGPAGVAIAALTTATNLAAEAFARQDEQLQSARASVQSLTRSYEDLLGATRQALEQQAQMDRVSRGGGSIAEQRAFTQQAQQRYELARRALAGDQGALAELRSQGVTGVTQTQPSLGDRLSNAVAGTPLLQMGEGERAAISAIADRAAREIQRRVGLEAPARERAIEGAQRGLGEAADRVLGGARGGESQGDQEAAAWDRYSGALERAREQYAAWKAEQDEAANRRSEATAEFEEQEQRKRDAAVETARLQAEEEMAVIEERNRALEAANRDLERIHEEQLDAARSQVAGYKEVTDTIVGGLTDALASIIDGSKTAEEAFLGLLASFLSFIAEKAALSAAEEAAQAIAAYARYDYASGAQHTAAAVAYGAVAIAAGAGSAAASSAASAAGRSASSEPERGRSSREQGNGGDTTIVIAWNSPVVTAQTKADLGRELTSMVRAGQMRYA